MIATRRVFAAALSLAGPATFVGFSPLHLIVDATGRVRFVFREFPLDIKAAAASMLARCIANGDAGKYFGAIDMLFKQQDQLMEQAKRYLEAGRQTGRHERTVRRNLRKIRPCSTNFPPIRNSRMTY